MPLPPKATPCWQRPATSTTITAGRDITTQAAQVQATDDLALNAGRDVNITTAQESEYSYDEKTKTNKYLFSSTTTHTVKEDYATTEKASQLSGDNVSIVAGQDLTVKGSSVVGDGDVTLIAGEKAHIGGSVTVDPGNDMLTRKQVYEQKQSGLTLSLSSPLTDAALAANSTLKRGGEVSDERLKTLYAVQAADNAWIAVAGASSMASDIAQGNMNAVKVEASVGSSKSSSESSSTQNQVRGSTLSAGRNTTLVATGNKGTSGDLRISGSGVTGNNVTLVAQNDLLLDAASNNTEQTSKNNSIVWNVGVHISLGQETGIGVSASGYQSKGTADGKSTEYVNTRVNASDGLSLSSGRDTVISGAQVLGEKITAEVGRDLTIAPKKQLSTV